MGIEARDEVQRRVEADAAADAKKKRNKSERLRKLQDKVVKIREKLRSKKNDMKTLTISDLKVLCQWKKGPTITKPTRRQQSPSSQPNESSYC